MKLRSSDTQEQCAMAFADVYSEHIAWMIREAQSWCKDQAQDVVHDTFLTLFKRGQEKKLILMAEDEQTRFLRRCLRNQIHKEWTRATRFRRGGGIVSWVSMDSEDNHGKCLEIVDERSLIPEGLRRTTVEEMQMALSRLQASMDTQTWRRLSPFLEISGTLPSKLPNGWKQGGAMRTALSRARSKLRKILCAVQGRKASTSKSAMRERGNLSSTIHTAQ